MRHGNRNKKLGRKREHRKALLSNLCRALFIHEKIRTTLSKAKEARRTAERLIEFAKQNTLAAKRTIYRYIPDHKLVKIICEEIGPKFIDRHGGYTRIYRLGPRLGDGAEMAIIELVEQSDETTVTTRRKLIQRRTVQPEKPKKEKQKKTRPEKAKKEPVVVVKKKAATKKETKAIKKKAKKEKKAKKKEKAKKIKKKR